MPDNPSTAELEAYLDEALPADEMARIEDRLRGDDRLLAALATIHARRDAGVHSLGEIWRRHRLTCPDREQLGNYLMGLLAVDETDYLRFHLEEVGCRFCQASLSDLESRHAATEPPIQQRRRRYFESSAGYLRAGDV